MVNTAYVNANLFEIYSNNTYYKVVKFVRFHWMATPQNVVGRVVAVFPQRNTRDKTRSPRSIPPPLGTSPPPATVPGSQTNCLDFNITLKCCC